MVALVVISLLTAMAIRPLTALLQKIKLQNSADGIMHLLLNARSRAVSNAYRHCGVVFLIHTSPTVNDTVFAFLDKSPPDYVYAAGQDSLYGTPYIVDKKYKIVSKIPPGYPSTIVFRGDGSADVSMALVMTLNNFEDTVKVLASTGKAKVKVK